MSNQVSAVIPSFNGLQQLEKNLPTVLLALRSGDELVIVDDASTDHSLQWLKETFTLSTIDAQVEGLNLSTHPHTSYIGTTKLEKKTVQIIVVQSHENLRFAGAANLGVAHASHSLILLLNTDVAPKKNILSYLLPHFDNSEVFAVGCLEYQTEENAEFASGKNKLWFERGLFQHARAEHMTAGETAWVSGGSGLFERSKWLALGGFDRRYAPAYWEDIDLSFRARKQGWHTLFEPKAVVYHHHETTNQATFGQKNILRMSWRNADRFTWQHGNVMQKLQFLLWRPFWWWQRRKHLS